MGAALTVATRVLLDTTEFDRQVSRIRRPQAALARALNRSLDSSVTLAARLVSGDMRLKVSTVKEHLKKRRATETQLTASLYASAKRVPLIDFNARGPEPSRGAGGGVRARTAVGRYPNAFIATVGIGRHRGVFERKGRRRLPIRELHGPSVWQSFQKFHQPIQDRAREQLGKNIAREIAYALSR